jgi:hypothetical protein
LKVIIFIGFLVAAVAIAWGAYNVASVFFDGFTNKGNKKSKGKSK